MIPQAMRSLAFSLVLFALLSFASCSSTQNYRISLKDGREFYSSSQPYFVSKTGYFRYKDLSGKDALVRAEEVVTINKL